MKIDSDSGDDFECIRGILFAAPFAVVLWIILWYVGSKLIGLFSEGSL